MKNFSTELSDDGIFTIVIDVPNESMNILNDTMISEFEALADEIENNDSVKAVIFISGKSSSFISGADIKMLQKIETAMDGTAISLSAHQLFSRISSSKKPHIAAINGACLGGGYELAMACHYRLASDDRTTKVGLPEVMLGLLPGGTGNSKLPRLINLATALDLLLTGKQLDSKRALRAGMLDEVVPNTILEQTAKLKAKNFIEKGGVPERKRSLKDKLMTLPGIKDFIIKQARNQVLSKTHGKYPAPLAILKVVQKGLNKPLNEALQLEATHFGELTVSPEAKQLINIYFATNSLKKESFIAHKIKPNTVNKLGILGAGLMGAGIATVSIDKANTSVRLKDIRDEGITSVYQYLNKFYQQRVKRRIISKEDASKKMNLFTSTLTYTGFENCDLIIEAVFEDIALKHLILNDIEALGNEATVFASNTSSIPITEIASQAKRPENILGMHYFSPVEKMPLLEIIKHKGTSDQALATSIEFGRQQGKTVIVVNDGAGFYVNRILAPYLNAALELGMEGVAFDKIDKALVNFGFPVGPIKLLDEVGLDVGSKILPVLELAFGARMAGIGVQQMLLDKGRLGKKVKKGFYRYDDAKLSKKIDDSIYQDLNITGSIDLPEKAIVERCVYRMLNEAALCLDDKIIDQVRDGDIGAIFGIGFPPFLGGPFRYMDTMGINYVVDKLKQLEKNVGGKYQPAEVLIAMAAKEASFYS
ncbi:MAG: 3-hydroxyacyl-CoA dehydrogenase/enoyl-CoA hydratase/3-hydroxybutyryl-CoA epimerase [Cellvibrionaceae bacterium]|jgi:3-hydroxyacyl-CoA dehydrogenase/enoyl-CoA hydratase/3-hydroxybutyryl-CoA epimerase